MSSWRNYWKDANGVWWGWYKIDPLAVGMQLIIGWNSTFEFPKTSFIRCVSCFIQMKQHINEKETLVLNKCWKMYCPDDRDINRFFNFPFYIAFHDPCSWRKLIGQVNSILKSWKSCERMSKRGYHASELLTIMLTCLDELQHILLRMKGEL